MDKSHPEPIEDNDKHDTKMQKITLSIQQFLIRVKLNNLSNLNHILQQVLTNQKHQNEHDNDSVKQDQDEPKEHHNSKKQQLLVLGTAGVAGVMAAKAKKHSNDAQNKVILARRITRLRIKRLKISLKIIIMAKRCSDRCWNSRFGWRRSK